LVLALPANHPLPANSEVDHQDLASEPIIWIAKARHPIFDEYFIESCKRLGYLPRIVHEINTVSEFFDLVGAGAGIGFVKRPGAERVRE